MKSLARATLIAFACAMLASAAGAQSQGPNAPGTIANDATVGTLPWTLLANAAVSDNMYTQVAPGGMPSQYLKVTNFGFAVPPAAVIDGITVSVERRSAAGLISDFSARIVKGGVIGATEKAIAGTWATTDTVVNYGGNTDLWGETWTAADINSSAFGFVLSATDNVDVAAVDAISITVTYSLCGDNQIGLSEDCDDGNTANGDCCSSTCQFDAMGTACLNDGNPCNGNETCDGAGNCESVVGPPPGCRTSAKGLLLYKDNLTNSKDKLVWKWIKGQATSFAELGVPTGTTVYTLCLYAGTAALGDVTIASGSNWAVLGANKGYKYKDKTGSSDGVTKAILKANLSDKSKALVKGKGEGLPDLTTPFATPVTVQLHNSSNNVCFTNTLTNVKKNIVGQFKAKAP